MESGKARGRARGRTREPTESSRRPHEPVPGFSGSAGESSAGLHGVEERPPGQEASAGGDRGLGRGASRGRQDREMIVTRPMDPGFTKIGKDGIPYHCSSNYFEVVQRPDWNLFQYRVDFTPDVEHMGVRKGLVRNHENVIGKYIFDGTLLYCVNKLPEPMEVVSVRVSEPEVPIRINLRLVGIIQKDDQTYLSVMNIIFRRCLGMLKLTEIKRNFYDPDAAFRIDRHQLNIWPGYLTSIRHHEEKLLLGVEIIFKVLRGDTALDVMNKVMTRGGDFRANCKAELEGKVVMTDYNKRTYRIDDIDFQNNPKSTFHLKKENREISYIEYYRTRYRREIRNDTQPLLVSQPTRRDRNRGDNTPVYLIPELCGMTGLSEEMRKNFQVTKDVGEVTRLKPDSRVASLMRFNSRLADHPEIMRELNSWGLRFSPNLVECQARVIPQEIIVQSSSYVAQNGDWSGPMKKQQMAVSASLREWVVFYPSAMEREVQQFIGSMQQCGRGMNFTVPQPRTISMRGDRVHDYTNEIRRECSHGNFNIVMAVMRSQRGDIYNAIKKLTCSEIGVPSQVITGRILKGDSRKVLSIATKVAVQIAAKMGAEPWRVKLPAQTWMVCGYDTYHDARQSRAVGAFIASFNASFTRYVSSVNLHPNNEEISASFSAHLQRCLRHYYQVNGTLPSKIFVYRDGVGAGDIQRVKNIEVEAIKNACENCARLLNIDYKPGIAFIVVSKRISSRFFGLSPGSPPTNPPPGTVIDNTVTLGERFDFFLVSQSVTQGSVSPTSFNVIEDTGRTSPDIHQRLAYALTHLYYNWPGTLRVPAPCQYAHKLAYLIGESVEAQPSEQIASLPYYL